jgi:hypothetical protein
MDLKTDTQVHYHGADGVYAGVTDDGTLKLYWGESKVYQAASDAIRDCLASLAPFLIEPEHDGAERERDLILLSDKADLNNPRLTEALKRYFDKSSVMSKRVQYCGVALVGLMPTSILMRASRAWRMTSPPQRASNWKNGKGASGTRLTAENSNNRD